MSIKSSQLLLPYIRPKTGADVLADYCVQKHTDIPKVIKLADHWSSLFGFKGSAAEALTTAGNAAGEIKWSKYLIALPEEFYSIFKESVSILSLTIYIYDKEIRIDIYTRTEKLFCEKILKTAKNTLEVFIGLEPRFTWLTPHRDALKGASGGLGIIACSHKTYKAVNMTIDYAKMSPEEREEEDKKGLFPRSFYLVALLVANVTALILSGITFLSVVITAFVCPPVAAFTLQTVNLIGETVGFIWDRSIEKVAYNKLSVSQTLYHRKELLCKV